MHNFNRGCPGNKCIHKVCSLYGILGILILIMLCFVVQYSFSII